MNFVQEVSYGHSREGDLEQKSNTMPLLEITVIRFGSEAFLSHSQ